MGNRGKRKRKRTYSPNNLNSWTTHSTGNILNYVPASTYRGFPEGSKTWHFMDKRIHKFLSCLIDVCATVQIEKVPSDNSTVRFHFQRTHYTHGNSEPFRIREEGLTTNHYDLQMLVAMEKLVMHPGSTRAPEVNINTTILNAGDTLVRNTRGFIKIYHSPAWMHWGFQGSEACSLLDYLQCYNTCRFPTITDEQALQIKEKQDKAFDALLNTAGIRTGRLP